ncbi:MAG: hypothetical protein BWY31_01520 [Lentisphaerae bacterium ADurb.Bin242]|nr:MAG: hypothetical protein BWY31_01520 [Lentisphaerae bacterium ADurb.Bin242]
MNPFLYTLISLPIQGLIGGTALWVAAKITKEQLQWKAGFIIALLSSLVSLLPLGGFLTGLLSIGLTLFLLYKWSTVDQIWPHAVILAVVAAICQYAALFFFLSCIMAFR